MPLYAGSAYLHSGFVADRQAPHCSVHCLQGIGFTLLHLPCGGGMRLLVVCQAADSPSTVRDPPPTLIISLAKRSPAPTSNVRGCPSSDLVLSISCHEQHRACSNDCIVLLMCHICRIRCCSLARAGCAYLAILIMAVEVYVHQITLKHDLYIIRRRILRGTPEFYSAGDGTRAADGSISVQQSPQFDERNMTCLLIHRAAGQTLSSISDA